jgi:two-component system, OmpR family, sensor kinase
MQSRRCGALAIGAWARRERLEIAWALFALANLVVMWLYPRWETVPFHFVWVSLTLLYGLHVWTVRATSVVLAAIMAMTGLIIVRDTIEFHENADEITEVPLMAAMFVAMVWHARRHKAAVAMVQLLASKERNMRRAEEAFVRTASHELRTPITIAHGHAELAREAQTDPVAIADLDLVIDELDRLAMMSNRLLTLAAAGGADFLSRRPFDVDEFVRSLARRWIPTAARRWSVESSGVGSILADRERLEAAVDALIENAVRFTDEADSIAICAEQGGGDVRFVIADTGAGISPDLVPRVFDAFARADFSRDQHTGGTGLGLAIVKAITDAHGGTVEVTSELEGGSTFVMCLPRHAAGVAHMPDAEPGESADSGPRRSHQLL